MTQKFQDGYQNSIWPPFFVRKQFSVTTRCSMIELEIVLNLLANIILEGGTEGTLVLKQIMNYSKMAANIQNGCLCCGNALCYMTLKSSLSI